MMIDTSDKLIAFGGSLSGIIAAALYAFYRSRHDTASLIQNVETVELGKELEKQLLSSDNHCIAYAAVEGMVKDLGKTFSSSNSSKTGVILKTSLVEHKSKRTQGFWADVKKVLRDTVEIAPFGICNPDDPDHSILVTEAAEADGLLDELEVIHDRFTPHTTSVVQASIDRIFGEVCRGIQETEQMLAVGTSLMGIGEIFLEDGRIKLRPPQADDGRYFLTRLSKGQLVKQFQSQATTFKVLSVLCGLLATSLLGLAVWRMTKKYLEYQRAQRDFQEIRRRALQRRSLAREQESGGGPRREDELCVVCLVNPREVVTLDCGHISMCSDCVQLLPEPHKCPVCREVVERFLPVFRP